MSGTAESLLEQLKKLPAAEQQEIVQQLLRWDPAMPSTAQKSFPTVKVSGGTITSQHVAEVLDDE